MKNYSAPRSCFHPQESPQDVGKIIKMTLCIVAMFLDHHKLLGILEVPRRGGWVVPAYSNCRDTLHYCKFLSGLEGLPWKWRFSPKLPQGALPAASLRKEQHLTWSLTGVCTSAPTSQAKDLFSDVCLCILAMPSAKCN